MSCELRRSRVRYALPALLMLCSPAAAFISAATARGGLASGAAPRAAEVAGAAGLAAEGAYSTNAICVQRHCLNPVFPGLQDLAHLEGAIMQCQQIDAARQHMEFCKAAVNYDVALPSPNRSMALAEAVRVQERAAVTAYRYHLAAMNLDAWEFHKPEESDNSCVRSIWTMLCHTYFPKSEPGCEAGQATSYLKPCRNVCESYIQACGVECCDESVRCNFDRPVAISANVSLLDESSGSLETTGYSSELGPSAQCTGATRRGVAPLILLSSALSLLAALLPIAAPPAATGSRSSSGSASIRGDHVVRRRSPWLSGGAALALVLLSTGLQGCDVIGHPTAAWQAKASYLVDFQTVPVRAEERQTGAWQMPASQAVLNSCEMVGLPREQQCSGRGTCKVWNETAFDAAIPPLSFCECDRDWADPECRTRRKSQAKAFFLSLFGGFLGLDRLYLGQYYQAFLKLSSLGCLGTWWIHDIVYIGSAPVYAYEYRVAPDLPHWLYVTVTVCMFAGGGILVLNVYGAEVQKKRQMAKMLLAAEDEFFKTRSATTDIKPRDRVGMPTKGSYTMPAPPGGIYGTMVPPEVRAASYGNQHAAFTTYEAKLGNPELWSTAGRFAPARALG